MKAIITSSITFALLLIDPSSFAGVTGEFKGVSFWATDGGKSLSVSGGSGTLRNEHNAVVAQGDLKSVDNLMTINGNRGASFIYEPSHLAFPEEVYSKTPVEQFANIELGQKNEWILKDGSFLFVLEVPDATQPVIRIALDKSLARASLINLSKGTYMLWGYAVTVAKESGSVKFLHGKLVDSSDAAVLPRPGDQDTNSSGASGISKTQSLDGAICGIDKANHTVKVIPWDKESKVWNVKGIRVFKLRPETIIEGETKTTIGELDGGNAVIKSFHLTGMGATGLTGTPFEIKDISQILHRRVTISWTSGAQIPETPHIALPYLFAGESMPAMVGSSGAQAVGGDDVTVGGDSQ